MFFYHGTWIILHNYWLIAGSHTGIRTYAIAYMNNSSQNINKLMQSGKCLFRLKMTIHLHVDIAGLCFRYDKQQTFEFIICNAEYQNVPYGKCLTSLVCIFDFRPGTSPGSVITTIIIMMHIHGWWLRNELISRFRVGLFPALEHTPLSK